MNKAPTSFGEVSYRIERQDGGTTRITLDPPTRKTAAEIRIHVRDPQLRKAARVEGTAGIDVSFSGDVIVLPGLSKPIELNVAY